MKRTLREHIPPLNIGVSTTKGDKVSFRYCGEKYTGKVSDTVYASRGRILYSFDRAVSDDGKIIEDSLVRDEDILEFMI